MHTHHAMSYYIILCCIILYVMYPSVAGSSAARGQSGISATTCYGGIYLSISVYLSTHIYIYIYIYNVGVFGLQAVTKARVDDLFA